MDLATCWSSRDTGKIPPKNPLKSKGGKNSLAWEMPGEMAVPSLFKGHGNVPTEGGNPKRHRLRAQRAEKDFTGRGPFVP